MLLLESCTNRPEISRLLCEADKMEEAAVNYKLAPMHVKNYYIALYCDLLEKYSAELAESGAQLSFSSEYINISLYQDAERYLMELHDGLMEIAFQRVCTIESKKGA